MSENTLSVLFVCLGNICRSPMAEGMFRDAVTRQGLAESLLIDSAGTGSWHAGKPPDRRAQATLLRRGIDISGLRGRQVARRDFDRFALVLAMDRSNLAALRDITPSGQAGLFLDFSAKWRGLDVPDPYYGGDDGFARVRDMLEDGCTGLLAHIRQQLGR